MTRRTWIAHGAIALAALAMFAGGAVAAAELESRLGVERVLDGGAITGDETGATVGLERDVQPSDDVAVLELPAPTDVSGDAGTGGVAPPVTDDDHDDDGDDDDGDDDTDDDDDAE